MKRSEINAIIRDGMEFCKKMHFNLPPFAFWSLEVWQHNVRNGTEIIDNQIGWDITDFGTGRFGSVGLLIFVLRNGNMHDPRYVKPYCEKILIQNEDQILPTHFHWTKMEDIINRAGGNLMVELYNAISDTEKDMKTEVTVTIDGQERRVGPGEPIRIQPGESITLMPRQFHKFWAEPGKGNVLLGEVSTVADEETDNNFIEYGGRLPEIDEDERPQHLLFNDYKLLQDEERWPVAWRT